MYKVMLFAFLSMSLCVGCAESNRRHSAGVRHAVSELKTQQVAVGYVHGHTTFRFLNA